MYSLPSISFIFLVLFASSIHLSLSQQTPECRQGEFYNVKSRKCERCAGGFFSTGGRITTCRSCPRNTFSSGSASKCELCPQGTSTTQEANIICKIDNFPCPSNYFTDKRGRCKTCRPGFRLNRSSKICISCLKNQWSRGGAVTNCFKCDKGKTVDPNFGDCLCNPGSIPTANGGCKKCPPGTKRPTLASSPVCERCFFGTFSKNPGSSKCTACSQTRFQTKRGQTKCLRCPKGTIQGQLSLRRECVSKKTKCPLRSKRVELPGSDFRCEQRPCPIGTFEKNLGNEPECLSCFPGRRFVPSSKECVRCGEKEFSRGGLVTSCTRCPRGFFQNINEGDKCRCTRAGYGIQSGFCRKCRPGTFSTFYNNFCRPCPVGTFTKDFGTFGACRRCEKGTFSEKRGLSVCKPCPVGKVSYGTGESSCVSPI